MLSQIKARLMLGSGPTVEGTDGWFFLSNHYEQEISFATGLKAASPKALDATAELVRRFGEACHQRGARLLFVPAPAKPGIYPDKLPAGLTPDPARSFLTQLEPRLDAAHFLDLRPILTAARSGPQPFSRLNSHWSDYGGWLAWRAIEVRLETLGLPAGALPLTLASVEDMDGFNEMEGLCRHIARNNWAFPHFVEPFEHIIFDLADGTESPQLGRRAVQLGDMPVQVRNPRAATSLSCLVVGDSSAVSLSPFFGRHFARVRYVRHPLIGPADEARSALAQEEFDLVLLAIAERYCPRLGEVGTLT
jgi:hypothetical protein